MTPGFSRLNKASLEGREQRRTGRRWLSIGALSLAAALAGCAVEFENKQAARELAQLSRPPGSVYLGWRVFQNKCAACHGASATGTAKGPNLLPRMRNMESRQFVSVVLKRYDWSQPATQARGNDAALDALIEQILQRKDYPQRMPAWEGEPSVNAHLVDLYAYLTARAFDTQGAGRPAP